MDELLNEGNVEISNDIKALARGPNPEGRSFNSYIINGFHFRTKSFESSRTTQNSGIMLRANTTSYASRRDRNPIDGEVVYYGVITDIIEIRYSSSLKFILFKCDWVDNRKGTMEDEFKFTLVNFDHLMYKDNQLSDEPFILATQAEQVFYSSDPLEPKWQVVLKMSRRDNYDIYSSLDQADMYSSQPLDDNIPIRDEDSVWVRDGGEEIVVEVATVHDSSMEEDDEA